MKNKFFKLTALWMVVVGLAACQSNENILPIAENLANQTLLGFYAYTTLDSASMQTTSEEYYLKRDENGDQKGRYRICVIGNGAELDTPSDYTWVSKMADDQMSMLIKAILEQGSVEKNVIWQDGIVKDGDHWFDKNLGGVSSIDVLKTIYKEQLTNVVLEVADTSFYDHYVDCPYLEWKSANTKNVLKDDTARLKAEKFAELWAQKDTIIWYLKNKTQNGYIGTRTHYANIDGRDTIIDLVYIGGSGEKFTLWYIKSQENKGNTQADQIKVYDWPSKITNSKMEFNRNGMLNTASYSWHKVEYSEGHYLRPGTFNDSGTDSLYTFAATQWVVSDFVNMAKFDVLMRGSGDSTISKIDKGVESVVKQKAFVDIYQTLNITEYSEKLNLTDSTVYVSAKQNNLEYYKK